LKGYVYSDSNSMPATASPLSRILSLPSPPGVQIERVVGSETVRGAGTETERATLTLRLGTAIAKGGVSALVKWPRLFGVAESTSFLNDIPGTYQDVDQKIYHSKRRNVAHGNYADLFPSTDLDREKARRVRSGGNHQIRGAANRAVVEGPFKILMPSSISQFYLNGPLTTALLAAPLI
jgi:hypothetical protein